VVERRYVDQRFAPEPERFRRPGRDDGPAWLSRPAPGRPPGLWTGVWPTLAALLAVGVVPFTMADVPWWMVVALVVHGVLAVVNAVMTWRFVALGRGFVHRGQTFYGTKVRCCAGLAVVTAGVAAMLWLPLTGDAPWTRGHLVAASALCGWFLLYWLPVLDTLAYRANHHAPPDLVQEALNAHDDRRLDELEADHGHTVCVCLLPS
jgi:hypothetical protein